MRVVLVSRQALGWLALVLACGALLWYAYSGPATVTTGVPAAPQPFTPPVKPHESGTPAPQPEELAPSTVGNALQRARARSERLEWLQTLAADPGTSTVTRDEVQRRLLEELDRAAKEEELEGLLQVEGFAGSLVVLNNRGLTISIPGRRLAPTSAARLGELASRMTGLAPERIVLMDQR